MSLPKKDINVCVHSKIITSEREHAKAAIGGGARIPRENQWRIQETINKRTRLPRCLVC
jgi:hypothetical protein